MYVWSLFVHNFYLHCYYPFFYFVFLFQVFESTCSIDIRYFPFDIQKCKMTFVAWSYTKFEVGLFLRDLQQDN